MSTRNLDKLFDPKSIAVIGASNKKGSVGYILLRNLIGAEYEGIVYPVNVSAQSVQGIQAYATISQVPRKIDLAIIAVPAKAVPETMRECGEAGVAGAVIVSLRLQGDRRRGQAARGRGRAIAESYGVRIVGPNCLGYIRPAHEPQRDLRPRDPAGRAASPSSASRGALGTAILDWAAANNVGFSAFVSVGSMSDVDFGDLIDYFGADPHTSSIILYIESITDARKFMSAARHFAKTKPIIVVKSGRTARSAPGGRQPHRRHRRRRHALQRRLPPRRRRARRRDRGPVRRQRGAEPRARARAGRASASSPTPAAPA